MKKISNIDWVFWVQIQRRDWFKIFWKSRGANFLTLHFLKWHISIGMPWLRSSVDSTPIESISKTNELNREGNKMLGRFRIVK